MTDFSDLYRQVQSKLKSKSKDERVEAVRSLNDVKDTRAIRILLSALNDNSAAVRDEVANLLKNFDHPAVVSGLVSMLDSEFFHVRKSAKDILTLKTDEKTLEMLCKFALDPETEQSLIPEIIPLISRDGSLKAHEITEHFIKTGDERILRAILEGLGSNKSDWAATLVIDLAGSTIKDIRIGAIDWLLTHQSPVMIQQLSPLILTPGHQGTAAVEIISRSTESVPVETIMSASQNESEEIRNNARLLLPKLDTQSAVAIAVRFLSDSVEMIRMAGVDLIKEKAAHQIVSIINRSRINSQAPWVNSAMELLAFEGSSQAFELLKEIFLNVPIDQQRQIIKLLLANPLPLTYRLIESQINSLALQNSITELLVNLQSEDSLKLLIRMISQTSHADFIVNSLVKWPRSQTESWLLLSLKHSSDNDQIVITSLLARFRSSAAFQELIASEGSYQSQHFTWAIGEIHLRKKLAESGIDSSCDDLLKLEMMASQGGWTTPDTLFHSWISKIGKYLILLNEKATISKQAGREKNDDKNLSLHEPTVSAGKTSIWKNQFLYLSTLLIGVAGTVFSFYKNWQPNASSSWYGSMVLFLALTAASFFAMQKVSKEKAKSDILTSRKAAFKNKQKPAQSDLKERMSKRLIEIESELNGDQYINCEEEINMFVKSMTASKKM